MINLIFLEIITILSNILAIILITLRIFNKDNQTYLADVDKLNQTFPLIKNDVWNLLINVILLIYCFCTMFVICKLFFYHMDIVFKNLTTYQDIKISSLGIDETKLPFNFVTNNSAAYLFCNLNCVQQI